MILRAKKKRIWDPSRLPRDIRHPLTPHLFAPFWPLILFSGWNLLGRSAGRPEDLSSLFSIFGFLSNDLRLLDFEKILMEEIGIARQTNRQFFWNYYAWSSPPSRWCRPFTPVPLLFIVMVRRSFLGQKRGSGCLASTGLADLASASTIQVIQYIFQTHLFHI